MLPKEFMPNGMKRYQRIGDPRSVRYLDLVLGEVRDCRGRVGRFLTQEEIDREFERLGLPGPLALQ